MNLDQVRTVLRPRRLGETLDLALRWQLAIGRRTFGWLAGLLLLPAALGCYALQVAGGWSWGEVWLLALVLATVLQGVFTVAAGRLMFEAEVSVREVLRAYFGRLPTYLVVLVLSRIVLLIGGLTVVLLPSFAARFAFVHEAVLLEGHAVGAALQRARRFSEGHLSTIVMLMVALTSAIVGGAIVADQLGHGLVEFGLQLGRPFGSLMDDGGSLYALLGAMLVLPFVATARFLHYVDARTRRDGWDIQVAFQALAVHEAGLDDGSDPVEPVPGEARA